MFPYSDFNARKIIGQAFSRYQEKVPTRILLLGDGRGGAASNVIAPGERDYLWARENSLIATNSSKYFPILNLGKVQPLPGLRVVSGYDPLSQYPNEEQILGIYQTEPVGIAARVTNTGALSAAHDNWRLLSYTTARFDSASMFDSGAAFSSRLTATTPGTYKIGCNVVWASNATGYRLLMIRRNSNQSATGGSVIATDARMSISGTSASVLNMGQSIEVASRLDIGDYVEAFVRQSSGGTLNVQSLDQHSPEMWLVRIEQNLV